MQTLLTNLIKNESFNTWLDNKQVQLFTLTNRAGMIAQITNYGGRLVSLYVPDRESNLVDVVLGHDSIKAYLESSEIYFGALIGRFANRINKGRFSLNSQSYQLTLNDGNNHIHGGNRGFHTAVWDVQKADNSVVELAYTSPNGEEGYPGNLKIIVQYKLTEENELKISYWAVSDQATPVSFTHHSFFNLNGAGNGPITDHILCMPADHYLPVDDNTIPEGYMAHVAGTPFDFRRPKTIGKDIHSRHEQIVKEKGYDHCMVLPVNDHKIIPVPEVYIPKTGIEMKVLTNEPGMQFYTGNFLNGKETCKDGMTYEAYGAFCLETQKFPDSPNQTQFPSSILNPKEVYYSACYYTFNKKE